MVCSSRVSICESRNAHPQHVFQALVDPAITSKLCFTKSTGTVVEGAELTWTWEMYGVSSTVTTPLWAPSLPDPLPRRRTVHARYRWLGAGHGPASAPAGARV